VRRVVRSVKKGLSDAEERNVKLIPDTPTDKAFKSPRARAIELQEVRTLIRDADRSLAKQDYEGAEKELIKALTVNHEDREVKTKLAKVYLETGMEPKAEALYTELLTGNKSPELYSNLGLTFYKQKKYTDSCHAYQESLNLDPQNPDRSYNLGRACIAAKRFEEAVPLLKKASQSLTKDIGLLRLLAECHLQLGDREGAQVAYNEINRLDPRDEDVKTKIRELSEVS
jgi:Flp pilus assembly protein TadD